LADWNFTAYELLLIPYDSDVVSCENAGQAVTSIATVVKVSWRLQPATYLSYVYMYMRSVNPFTMYLESFLERPRRDECRIFLFERVGNDSDFVGSTCSRITTYSQWLQPNSTRIEYEVGKLQPVITTNVDCIKRVYPLTNSLHRCSNRLAKLPPLYCSVFPMATILTPRNRYNTEKMIGSNESYTSSDDPFAKVPAVA